MKPSFKLSAEQRRALQEELRKKGLTVVASETIPVRSDPARRLLSFGQQRLWFLDQLAPGSAAYHMPSAVRFRGPLEIALLARACAEIIRRHEALRASFPARNGEPFEVLAAPGPLLMPLVDLSGLPRERRQGTAREWGRREAARPFDLQAGALLRAALFRLDGDDHVALFVLHHIIGDGRSSEILVRELGTLYAAFSRGLPSPLAELPIQYADFAAWQQERLAGERLEKLLAWWREELAGAPEELGLPTDRPRQEGRRRRNAILVHEVPLQLHTATVTLGQRFEATPFMGYLAVLAALLHVYTGRQDLIVGTPVLGRDRTETADLIGFFVNTLALRSKLEGDLAFGAHLARIRATVLGALQHQDLPFERLIEELRPERRPGRSPLVDLMFLLEGVNAFQIPGLSAEPFAIAGGEAKLDMVLAVRAAGERMWLAAEYDADLFDAPTIRRLLHHFEALLTAVDADPERPLSQCALLSEGERQQALREWNPPPLQGLSVDASVPELIARWVRETPDAVAGVDAEGRCLTYRELGDGARRLACRLECLGVVSEKLVGVCLERSLDTLIALTAVLWGGGAYLPLDPDSPPERLSWQLRDSGAAVLVTRRNLVEHCGGAASPVHLVLLDEGDAEPVPAQRRNGLTALPPHPASLAYVIYTSGSTGRPKGVCVSHAGLVQLMGWWRARFRMMAADRSTLLVAPGFDASVLEIWPALTAGASVHIPPAEARSAPGPLLRWLAGNGCTVSFLPTPLTDALLAEAGGSIEAIEAFRGLSLRALTTGGDRLQRRPARGLGFELVNLYGPTEITVMATAGRVEAEPGPEASGAPSIGRAIAGVAVYLVDGELSLVPVGVRGEMLLGGASVARGYLGRPDLTAGSFLPDPFSGQPGARLYRTGDAARRLPDGRLDFMGRLDHQVKIRGVRIEPGEIEAALARHPGVREQAVVSAVDAGGQRRLVACVVGEGTTASELRAFLRGSLPEPMVPSSWVFLEELPLTSHGKVDYRALARVVPDAGAASPDGRAPRTPVEEILAGIWAEVLRRDDVGADDDFFALGGHSLLATRVLARIRESFRVELPLRVLFENPTLEGLAARIGAALRRAPGDLPGELADELLARSPERSGLPLSFSQQRLWFLDQLHPGSSAYNIPAAFRLTGRLDAAVLTAALGEIVRRHEALRTIFRAAEEGPRQEVTLYVAMSVPLVDLTVLPQEARWAEALRLAGGEARRPFDLAAGPLLRVTLLRLESGEHALLATLHHIAADGWSVGVMMRELAVLYTALAQGGSSPLPELPVQYADFALWQRRRLPSLDAELDYWRDRLAGAPAPLELPADRPRPAVHGERGARRTLLIPEDTARGTALLARRLGATPFMVVLAAFQALLARWTGEEDISVGTPVAGRHRVELEGLIGFFVNTLVLRTDLSGSPRFDELVTRVREASLGAYSHQELPFDRLVEELAPERRLAETPLFQVLFSWQSAPVKELDLQGLAVSLLAVETAATKLDLTLRLAPVEQGLRVQAEYSTDRFDGTTIDRLLAHLERLLTAAVLDPGQRLGDLPLTSGGERQQLLEEWNDTSRFFTTARPEEAPVCLHELFDRQAARAPEALAVEAGSESLTFREVAERSGRLAGLLRRLGVGRGSRVGLCLPRSPRSGDALVAILGTLRAGGAYVPLDPGSPAERLASILGEAGIRAVLTHESLRGSLPAGGFTVICLDAQPDASDSGEPSPPAEAPGSPDDLAYVLYTSGSTGRPKGVMVEHRSVLNLLTALRETVYEKAGARLRVAVNAPLAFDASVKQWIQVLDGHALRWVPEEVRPDAERMLAFLRQSRVQVLDCTPGQLGPLVAAGLLEEPGDLERVLVGGEEVPPALWASLAASRRPAFFNVYGPTECTVDATVAAIRGERPSLGRPLPNVRVHLLSAALQPVPAGVAGELCVAGAGVARGYLGRPAQTAERFVPEPRPQAPGGRIYRTGDLARRRPDGSLEFIGRVDRQVKLRGFRVELGEIEAALAGQPAVREAVVLALGEGGERRLVACVVPAGPGAAADELRTALRRSLPEPMVPAAWVFLDKLPLTANGKVDRRALARLDPAPGTASQTRVAPRTPVEEILAGIWTDVFPTGVAGGDVGIEDDFFELGGHSLLATQLVARVRRAFHIELPVRAVFEAPTVAGMAQLVEAELRQGGADDIPLVPAPRGGPLPLSFAQERLWFLDRLEPGSPTYDIPVTVDLHGSLLPAVAAAALGEVARRHEALRTTFGARDGVPFQRVAPPAAVALPVIDLGALPAAARQDEAARLGAWHSALSFDLERGPLFAATLLRLEPDVHRLLFNMHHIISDGWSNSVLVRELSALYEPMAAGRSASLPELPVQYPDFALWQRRWTAGRGAELGYWMERLGSGVEPLDLPLDRPRPAVQTYRGDRRMRRLPSGLSARLQAFGRREGATLFMVLLAGAAELLRRQSGQEDVLVGTPVAGRRAVETEGLIGCFLNTLVLRTDLSGRPGLRELVARVREVTLGAFSHQDVPFEELLSRLGVKRDLSRTPLFQVFFNLLSQPAGELRLPGLRVEAVSTPEPASKFDMTFYVQTGADGIRFDLVFNADLFDGVRMEELLAQLELLLEQAVESPEQPLAGLSLVTPRAAALLPSPLEALDGSWRGAVHELFAEQARRAPERPAVVDREGVWSYGELAAASDRLAGWLAAHGIRRGDRVAIYAHRSAPVVQAVLGTMAAGGAFVLLDPGYPAARLVDILRLAAPSAWLQVAAAPPPAAVGAWLADAGCPRLELPGGGAAAALAALDAWADGAPAERAEPDDVAFLGFTSGSTGTPKGILGRHGPLSHFLPWQCERFALGAEDRFSLLSALAHDPLQRDIFTPLYLGAAIIIPDPEEIPVAGCLAAWMAREGVTVAHLTPAMGQLLTERPAGGTLVEVPGLRLVMLVGDALTRNDVERLRRLAPGATVVNLYGSTETQRAVAFHVVESGAGDARLDRLGRSARQVLPLGRGMQDVQLLVLNQEGRLAGVGEIGEIVVRSPHLAAGYLGDSALTAEKFQVNPFTGAGEDRLYRTGDLGRYLPDGEVTFAGRADFQVKIRGFRIEPGEIEAVLASLDGVREAVVLALEQRGERRLAACVVPQQAGAVAVASLREASRERLPAYMVPSSFVLVERLPLTPNGKVDRKVLARIAAAASAAEAAARIVPAGGLEQRIAAIWQEVLGIAAVGTDDNFFDLGGHSLLLVRLHSRLQELLGREIPLVELFASPTVRAQAARFGAGDAPLRAAAATALRPAAGGAVAIIGMAGRFPKARDLDEFWRNLSEGVEAISFFSAAELAAAGRDPEQIQAGRYVAARGLLEDAELFDAAFFGVSPREARSMDPQLRLFLECAWEALEDAGCDPERFPGSIGVYGGASTSTYFLNNLIGHTDLLRELGGLQVAIHTDRDYLTTQVSYKLGLTGPSLGVQTACSTSLVAVHLARQALLSGDCDVALAGGVSVKLPQVSGYFHNAGGIDSADGHCRAFDAGATGTVWGNGLGVIVLKRLEDALADGDPIRAVLRGTALNNDGSLKVGYTAPSLERQAAVVAAAQAAAGVPAGRVSYLEAHGTGTQLGDPIEVAALARVFGSGPQGSCALGSVKTNIGHLGAAAGIAGLIKVVLALEHREIPPSLHFEQPNPAIDFAASPFYVNVRHTAWPAGGGPRCAGVSSFGLGGTNAHAVLEEAPPAPSASPAEAGRPWQLLPLSARSEEALDSAAARLARWLESHPDATLATLATLSDIAWTLQTGRRAFPFRRTVVCRTPEEARRALAAKGEGGVARTRRALARRPVVFLFPGQGAQHLGMARGLYETEPVFRREMDTCAELLAAPLGRDLRALLWPWSPAERAEAEEALGQTRFVQPALFAVEHALARLWMSWGVAPAAMLGHSLGEYVAACLAGVFSLEDALALVAARGELVERLPAGAMLSIELPEAELRRLLEEPGCRLDLAAVNAPSLGVAAGPEEEIAGLAERLTRDGVSWRRLRTSHGFHSAVVDPVLPELTERMAQIALQPPSIPYVSNLTGDWITAAEATDPAYWAQHLRRTVRFGEGAARLLAEPSLGAGAVLLEVGPGRSLGSFARLAAGPEKPVVLASMRRARDEPADDLAVLLDAAGSLWAAGAEIAWAGLHSGERRRRVRLPTYPFERRRHWIEPRPLGLQAAAPPAGRSSAPEEEAGPAPVAGPWSAGRNEDRGQERKIAALFARLLGLEEVGPHDDFFELGGHSLLGTRLVSRLRDELEVELPLEALFEAPTPAGLAARVDALRAQAKAVPVPPILRRAPASRPPELPLSFAQERLWFLDQLSPGSPAYNIPLAMRLAGRLDVPALSRAMSELARRHEILRTTFPAAGESGRPVQRIAPFRPLPLPQVDLAWLPAKVGAREAHRLAGCEARRPFDLEHGPLLRTALLHLSEGEHRLLLTLHHTIVDGWSLHILGGELTALYAAFAAGARPALPELPVQYADYALWQRDRLAGPVFEEQLAFWKERLGGELPVLDLPADRPRPAVESFRGGRERIVFPAVLSAALAALGQAHGATLFMTLLAAFDAVLWRSTRQRDVIVGSPIAGRIRPEIEPLIGLFVNTLALRVDLAGDPPFLTLLARVREATLAAYAHQELPFERLIGELYLRRDLGRSPLFQVMLILQNMQGAPGGRHEAVDLVLEGLPVETGAAKLDLTLTFQEGTAGLYAAAEYSTDLFDAVTVRRLLTRTGALLAGIAERPGAPLSDLPLLTAAESHQLLTGWNDTGAAAGGAVLVHELVAAQAARTPEAVALLFQSESLTYRELAARVGRLAGRLAALGVGPEVKVALCCERSPALVVALLAVLTAGGAYVPLDPRHPRERLALILADCGAPVLLTEERSRGRLPAFAGTVVLLDGPTEGEAAPEGRSAAASGNLAYAIYTSGSTGRPKGVEIEHRGLTSFLADMAGRLSMGPEDLLVAVTTISFDIAALEVFLPLITGARLALLPSEVAADGEALARFLLDSGATVMQATPATWRMTIDAGLDRLPRLKALCGGEALTPDLARALTARAAEVWNVYGPTETTIWSAAWRVPGEPGPVSVGRPIAGTRIYVLDGHLPVPPGAAGELAIGGVGLARGYLGRPDLTAERFVPDPFAPEPGARTYRTGDLARFGRDGALEVLGRLDHQVKIRGFRIELGEIEAHLAAHPAIREAAVLARERGPGERHLVAYTARHAGGDGGKGAELRDFLRERLPDYMVPAVYVELAALPLNPSGKVDRRALSLVAAPGSHREGGREGGDGDAAPGTETEERLAGIWREVLRIPRVGVHDNFFELGGDSVLSIQILSRARRAGLALTARQIFEQPTIAGLAALAVPVAVAESGQEDAGRGAARFPLAGLEPAALERLLASAADIEDLYPLSPLQQGMLFHTLHSPQTGIYVEQLSLDLHGDLDVEAFRLAWDHLIRRHPILRTRAAWREGPSPLQVVHREASPGWELLDWRDSPAAERAEKLAAHRAADRQRGFELDRAPLLRFSLIRTSEESFRFVWTYHHLLLDGWSLPLLLRELSGEARREPAPTYREYIAWLARQDAAAAEGFWRRTLQGFHSPSLVAVERPAAEQADGRAGMERSYARIKKSLSPAVSEALAELARAQQVTLNTIVQGATAFLLSRYSGKDDVLFGAVSSGRSVPLAGIETIVGLFINTLPVRVGLSEESGVSAWLRELQAQQAEMRQYESVALAQLRAWSQVPRDRPLFDSILVFESYPVDHRVREEVGRAWGVAAVEMLEQTHYPLTVVVTPGRSMRLEIAHDTRLFEPAAAARMLGHFESLLLAMVARPGGTLGSLPLLGDAERQVLLFEWNGGVPAAGGSRLHEIFARQAARTPDAPALLEDDRRLTYRELDERSNRLAQHLRRLGVGIETRVGLCCEPSMHAVVGILGILKAGGAYVPLDPTFPRERLALMVEDALGGQERPVLLSEQSLAGLFQAGFAAAAGALHVIRLDADWPILAAEPPSALSAAPPVDHQAYVIYTSGSSSRPKGVVVTHRGVVNFVRSFTAAIGIGGGDRTLLFAPLAFDASVLQIFSALASGAALVLHRRPRELAGDGILGFCARQGITVLDLPAAFWRQWVSDLAERRLALPPGLRAFLTGGESVPVAKLRAWAGLTDRPAAFLSSYGPTEATITATVFQTSSARVAALSGAHVPIGRPLAGVEAYVLDARLRPTPRGVAGELHLAGEGLARGYLGRPGVTAEKFLPNPFREEPGARMYKTGDLVRHLPDGSLEFLGRIDSQVKARGFRVELGEIEAALAQHSGVREVVVVQRDDLATGQGLVAYLVPREGADLVAAELRALLKQTLPEHMVPAHFQILERLPLTASAKVDRGALPLPESPLATAYTAPLSALETLVAEVWSEALGVQRVGRDDNFFDLGGHSLLMIQVHNKLQERLQRNIAMIELFRHSAVSSLAAFLGSGDAAQTAFVSPGRNAERRAGAERLKQRLGRRQG